MSLQTKVNGLTAWANFRLQLIEHDVMKNILTDFMDGYNMKILVESLTGRTFKKLKTFEGLSLTQKETRVRWIVDELKACDIVDEKITFDYRLIASKIADEVFKLFWEMVCHDLQFLWVRSDFLQQNDVERLVTHPIEYIPPAPVQSREGSNILVELMSKQSIEEKVSSKDASIHRDKKIVNESKLRHLLAPVQCLFEMINNHLKMTRDGRKLPRVTDFEDLIDSRVLCALVNSIVPDTLTAEVLLNDRWTVNLALQIMMEMSRCSGPFYAEDLVKADSIAVGAYFAFFFMSGYSLCQARAVVARIDAIKVEVLKRKEELLKFPSVIYKGEMLKRKNSIKEMLVDYNHELWKIEANYKIDSCREWMKEIRVCQDKVRTIVAAAMKRKYEILNVPSNSIVNEFAAFMMINLSLTPSYGFYECVAKETLTIERKIIVQDKKTGVFFDSSRKLDGKKHPTAKKVLDLPTHDNCEINPSNYSNFTIYLEALTCNKMLKADTMYVYKIFADDLSCAQNILFKAIREREFDTVKNLVSFFNAESSFINGCYGDAKNTPLHVACRNGYFNIALYLLEENALVDALNGSGYTPFFMAVENGKRNICKLLIEWGTDINIRNRSGVTALSIIRNKVFLDYIQQAHAYWQLNQEELLNGRVEVLQDIINNHMSGEIVMATLRSRCVNGSTLLHVASYYSDVQSVKRLLSSGLKVNIRDRKKATALHRAGSVEVIEVLREHDIDMMCTDQDGNTSLHVRCYGELGKQTDVECIKELISKGVKLLAHNNKGLMAIHCAAIQGRHDAIKELLNNDPDETIKRELAVESEAIPPSILYLAAANGCLLCAEWLKDKGFHFKEKEVDKLLEKILMEQLVCEDTESTIKFLYANGASSSLVFPGNNTALHLAASQLDLLEVLKFCIQQDHKIDALNDDMCTPLHFAVQANNVYGAALLIEHNANSTLKNRSGLTPFDLIKDFDHWVKCELFDDITREMLRAFHMKQARQLVYSITHKVNQEQMKKIYQANEHARRKAFP